MRLRPLAYNVNEMFFSKTKTRNIIPSRCIKEKIKRVKSKKMQHGLKKVLNFCFLCGFPLTSSILKPNAKDISQIKKMWCYFLLLIKTVLFFFSMSFIYQLFDSITVCAFLYAVSICGNLLTWLVFLRRKTLYSALQNLCSLAIFSDMAVNIGGNNITCQIIVFALAIVTLSINAGMFFLHDYYNNFLHLIYFPPFISQERRNMYLSFELFCVVSTYCLSVLTGGFIYFICKSIYKAIGDIINAYRQKLQEHLQSTVLWTVKTMSDDISHFKNVTLMVTEIEEAFGIFVLMLYATIMCGFFNTFSVVIQSNRFLESRAAIFYTIWTFCAAFITFVDMSRYGSYISSQVQSLKRQMIVCADQLIRSSPPQSTMDVFHYLFEIVMKSQIEVTGYGIFVINCGLVLTIISTLITYSVLILQLDSTK